MSICSFQIMNLCPVLEHSSPSVWNVFTIGPLNPSSSVTSSPHAGQRLLAQGHMTPSFKPSPSASTVLSGVLTSYRLILMRINVLLSSRCRCWHPSDSGYLPKAIHPADAWTWIWIQVYPAPLMGPLTYPTSPTCVGTPSPSWKGWTHYYRPVIRRGI